MITTTSPSENLFKYCSNTSADSVPVSFFNQDDQLKTSHCVIHEVLYMHLRHVAEGVEPSVLRP